jgi:chromosome segregation ATPase
MNNPNPLADEIVQLNTEILALEQALEIATADRDAARKANERLTDENKLQWEHVQQLLRENEALQAERDRLTAELHGVQADYHAVQAERDEWIERWRKDGVLYSQLQAELDSATAAAADVGRQAERLRAERDLMRAAAPNA